MLDILIVANLGSVAERIRHTLERLVPSDVARFRSCGAGGLTVGLRLDQVWAYNYSRWSHAIQPSVWMNHFVLTRAKGPEGVKVFYMAEGI